MDQQTRDLARQQAEFCKIFGNANRILILWALGTREMSVSDIARSVDGSLQNTSQHLSLMRNKGILESRRDGHLVLYRIRQHELLTGCPVQTGAPLNMPLNENHS
jgi:DNA-binding transcriptional ArsR family regulator